MPRSKIPVLSTTVRSFAAKAAAKAIVVAALVFAGSAGQADTQSDVSVRSVALTCSNIVPRILGESATEAGRFDTGGGFIGRLKALIWADNPESVEDPRDGRFYVTTTSGNARFIDCSSGMRSLVYFPVGRTVQGKVSFEQNGQTYLLAETEHGLHLIFNIDWLSELGEEDVFFFHDGYGKMPICRGGEASAGLCDAFARPGDRLEEPLIDGSASYTHSTFDEFERFDVSKRKIQVLQQQNRFFRTYLDHPTIDTRRRSTYLGMHFDGDFAGQSDNDIAYLKKLLQVYCSPINAGALYSKGKKPDAEPDYRIVTLSLCQYGAQVPMGSNDETVDLSNLPAAEGPAPYGLRPRPVKIVTLASATERVSPAVSIVFPNASDAGFGALLNASASLKNNRFLPDIPLPESLYAKDCQQTVKTSIERDIGVLAGIGGDAGLLKAELEAKLSSNFITQNEMPKEQMYRSAAMLILRDVTRSKIYDPVRDIRMVSTCEGEVPKQLISIVIQHPVMDLNKLEIDALALLSAYSDVAARLQSEGVEGIVPDYGKPGSGTQKDNFIEGVFWDMKDHNEYLLWRDTFRAMIGNSPKFNADFGTGQEADMTELRMLDHVSHMLMTAIFRSSYDKWWDDEPINRISGIEDL